MTAKTTKEDHEQTLEMSSAPAAIPLKPSNPAMPASTRNKKAHLSKDIDRTPSGVERDSRALAPDGAPRAVPCHAESTHHGIKANGVPSPIPVPAYRAAKRGH